jgi:hypothetical protein
MYRKQSSLTFFVIWYEEYHITNAMIVTQNINMFFSLAYMATRLRRI